MTYNAVNEWENLWFNSAMSYPSEYVIRILKGKYPNLQISSNDFSKKKIIDLGCGDGRNLPLLYSLGFDVFGAEISNKIINTISDNLKKFGINDVQLKVGTNDNMPFEDNFADYLLSWNSCYYMGNSFDFDAIVDEYSRILKKDGYLILSIPKKTCFIYRDSEMIQTGFRKITNDPFNVRNGEILRMFESENEIEKTFSKHFDRFIIGDINDDCFGLNYHWHIIVCQKK